jgi:hypothetical protein
MVASQQAKRIVVGFVKLMVENVAVQPPASPLSGKNFVTSQPGPSLYGSLANLACKCSTRDNVDFLIKDDRIVCAFCDREIVCLPPVIGVFKATCACCNSPSIKSTFVLDSRGIYTCTWCGRTR